MSSDLMTRISRRASALAGLVAAILIAGTVGYRWLSDGRSSWLDCLYMTVITVTTIGYGEVVDLSRNAAAIRAFSMFVAVSGIGVITYAIGSVTSFAVDGELRARLRRRTMLARIGAYEGHYVICGWGALAPAIATELKRTGRTAVAVVAAGAEAEAGGALSDVLAGDIASDELLRAAGVERAAGVFAAADDDHLNIIIALSARRLNGRVRIVAAARQDANAVKMRRAGADATVSAIGIGGLRMASEMLRPSVVTFLDTMLRSSDPVLRVEEARVGATAAGRRVDSLQCCAGNQTLLVAHRRGESWTFKPLPDLVLREGDCLVFLTSPAGLGAIRAELGCAGL